MDMKEKLIKERVELCDVIICAMRDWDDYMDECRETETPPIDSFEDFIADAVISAGYRKREWISVKDWLPEDDDSIHFYGDERMRCATVLAYTEYGRIIPKNRLIVKPTGNKYLDTQVTDGWEWARGTEEVTHWMPQPQPPKGE